MANKVKIKIPISENSFSGKTLWAEQVDDNLFRLLNIPFFAFGYAEGDIVRCEQTEGLYQAVGLENDSGNGTLRLVFAQNDSKDIQYILDELVSVGCTYEMGVSKLIAVTVPPNLEIPFSQLSNFLNGTKDKVLAGWEVAKNLTRNK